VGELYPLENFGVKALAVAIIIAISWLNSRSVKAGSQFQVWSTAIKIIVIAALIFGILFSGKGEVSNFVDAISPKQGSDLLNGFIIAMTGAFFAYDGAVNITCIAGEIKQPQRNIPLSLFIGVSACILIYVLVNQAYLYVLPIETIAGSKLVAADAIGVAWGAEGSSIIAALIVICTLGAVNGNIMSTCRVSYAMAKDRNFPGWVGHEHKQFNTPANALWLHCVWISILVFSGSFNMLADMFVFVTWIAYLFGALGLFILRKKYPGMERPYKTWGYPVVPALFIIFSAFYLFLTVQSDVRNYLAGTQPVINSVLGLFITAIGIPLFYYYKWRSK
jgi:basic amino acid/polyamine antiporter, APA family